MNCKTLTMIPFINALCNNDLSGIGTQEQWNVVLSEFYELQSDDSEYKETKILLSNYAQALARHTLLTSSYNCLIYGKNDTAIQSLLDCGFKWEGLKKLKSDIKNAEVSLKKAQHEWETYQKKDNKKLTEKQFMSFYANVCKYNQINLPLASTTVFEFCAYSNLLKKELNGKGKNR